RFGQIGLAERISPVRRSRRHHPLESVALSLVAVDVEKRRIDAQLVARQTGQSLNVKRRAGNRIPADRRNTICSEDKHIPVVRLNKVVAEFIDKHLIARVDRASGYDFAAMTKPTGKDVEILTKRVRRGVYEKTLPLTHEFRKSKKERDFSRHDLENLVVLARNNVNVIATQNKDLHDWPQIVGRRAGTGMPNDPIKGRLHRAGGNFERLQKIRANPDRDYDRPQDTFAVFPPMRFPSYRRQLMQRFIKYLR